MTTHARACVCLIALAVVLVPWNARHAHAGTMFWADQDNNKIQSADLDGGNFDLH